MVDAIILAGGASSESLSKIDPQPYEALIEIAGQPMVTFVARALAGSSHIGQIYVVGPVRALANCTFPENTILIEGGKTILDTIKNGLNALKHQNQVLIATADIPLLTGTAVSDFLEQCSHVVADLYYPIVTRETNNRRYPGNERTYVRLQEGTFTGGNLFLVNPAIFPQCREIAEHIIANRKNPLKLASFLGWTFLLKFVLGMLSVNQAERRVSEILGIRGAVIYSPYPELGMDVDKPSDLELVRTAFCSSSKMQI